VNIICQCGHRQRVHKLLPDFGNALVCMCHGKDTLVDDCYCYRYVPDNLLHIENLAKERKLI
jgi:hypothetical protein